MLQLITFLLAALLISSVNALTLSDDAKIMSLTDSGGNSFLHDKSVYQAAANKLLASSIWNRNKITVNTGSVSESMLEQFPELSSVSVTLPLVSKRPVVYVQTAQPALVLAAQNGSFVIDTTGKALLPADKLPSGSQLSLPLVTDQSGLKAVVNRGLDLRKCQLHPNRCRSAGRPSFHGIIDGSARWYQ